MDIRNAILLAIEFLKRAEKFEPTPYRDSGEVLTNGFGNTRLAPNNHVSLQQAILDLRNNLYYFNTLIAKKVKPQSILKLQDHQYAAILSFAFNCGVGNWRIWSDLSACNFSNVPAELLRFDHGRVNGQLVEIKGLKNRREAEISLWKTQDLPTQPIPTPRIAVQPKPKTPKISNETATVTTVGTVATVAGSSVIHQSPQLILPVIVGLICLLILLMFYMLYRILKAVTLQKGQVMSDAFNKAFADYQAAVNAQQIASEKVIQDKLDAANTEIATLTQQLADQDAADIKVVTDATAAISTPTQSNGS